MAEFMKWASCGRDIGFVSDCDHYPDYWRELKKALRNTDRRLAYAIAERKRLDGMKDKQQAEVNRIAREFERAVTIAPWLASAATENATTLGIDLGAWWTAGQFQDSRYESELDQREGESESDYWARLATFLDCEHEFSYVSSDCFPVAWKVDKPLTKHGGTIRPRGYLSPSGEYSLLPNHATEYHKRQSGLGSIAREQIREPIPNIFSLPAFDRLGGAELQPGLIVNAPKPHGDIVAEQIETIAQDALEDIEAIRNPNTSFMERIDAVCRLGRVVQYRQQRRKQFTPDPKTVEQRNQEARQARVAAYLQSH